MPRVACISKCALFSINTKFSDFLYNPKFVGMKECKCKLIVLGEFVRQRVFFFAPFSPGSRKYIKKRTLVKMFKPIERSFLFSFLKS